MDRQLITLTSDFGVQTQGVGLMEGVAQFIAPEAQVIHLMHGLPAFDVTAAARTLESVRYLWPGAHVCVCDPGVGSDRKPVIIEVERGDFLVGPDNGVLIPASRILGGIKRVHLISNTSYMRTPVSPIFHGRDIFVPTAAYLCSGVKMKEFGPVIDSFSLVPAPYADAVAESAHFCSKVIQINRFGSIHLNITHEAWGSAAIERGSTVEVSAPGLAEVPIKVGAIFSDVKEGECVILPDDYGRVEIAVNKGSFVQAYPVEIGDEVIIRFGDGRAQ